jgi:periplasmic divalent cation tolerance protein
LNKKIGQPSYIVVLVTVKDPEAAQKITSTLLKRRQAACINIVPGVESHFWWKDKLDSSRESLLIVKTKEALLPDVIRTVKKLHGESIPEIIALPIIGGSRDYLEWLDSETI